MPVTPRTYTSDAELLGDIDSHLYAFDGDAALFMAMDQAAYARSIFLDRRISPAGEGVLRRPIAALLAALPTVAVQPPAWIFHMAHTGSTLLARGLDDESGALVLREPLALRQLGVAAAWRQDGLAEPLRLATTLYGRRRTGAAATIIKANVPVNFLIPALLATGTPAVLLYFPLARYVTAVLRSDANRNWVRFVTDELKPGIEALVGPIADADDASRAAALWLAQIWLFAAAQAQFPAALSLDADTLFDRPAETLAAAARHLGRSADADAIAAAVGGPIFNSYSKNPGVAFDNQARRERQDAAAAALADELTTARGWIAARRDDLPERLARPLVGAAPLLVD